MNSLQNKCTIHVIVTGGTIDGIEGNTPAGHKSPVVDYLQGINPNFTIVETIVCLKDSREINDADRAHVYETILQSANHLFLVTHGTWTMCESAEYILSKVNKLVDKTVVFVGSFKLGLVNSFIQIKMMIYSCQNKLTGTLK